MDLYVRRRPKRSTLFKSPLDRFGFFWGKGLIEVGLGIFSFGIWYAPGIKTKCLIELPF